MRNITGKTNTANANSFNGSNTFSPHRSTTTTTASRFGGDTRRPTERELQDKRAKGLCFRCDERWGVGHQCKRKEVSVLLVDEDDDQGEEEDREF